MDTEFEIDAGEHIPPFPQLCRYLSERSPQPMVAVDGSTHVVHYVNHAFAELVGIEAQDLIGQPFAEVVPEGAENGCLALLDRVFRSGISENLGEQEHLQSLPQPVYWSYAVWPILGTDKQPVGVMIQITDATETALFRRQSVAMNESLLVSAAHQHELTEVAESMSDRLQTAVLSRDHFLAAISHELRNPLATLSYGLQLLKLAAGDQELAKNSQETMERQLNRMVRLVDDLLDISRITTGKLELHKVTIELSSVVKDAVEASRVLMDAGDHELAVILPPSPVWLEADPVRLVQVFLNLLHNAAKYSEPCKKILLTARLDGSEVEISIQDQGIGIPADQFPHIFESFVQLDMSGKRTQGGMGIGLSLVKQFVELHGGSVDVRSRSQGQGTEFLVRLPVTASPAAKAAIAEEDSKAPFRRILVVDDRKELAEMLGLMLKMMGHEVRIAEDGEQAVDIAAEFGPALVLMDLGMPKLDGYEAARRMRAQPWGKNIFLIALSGWGAEEDRKRAQASGFDGHLLKPVDLNMLKKLIAEMPV